MKKIYAALLASAVITAGISTAVYASPLKSYEPGKVAIDAGITLPSSIEGDNYKMSKSDSTYLGATVGLGSNTALNYRWDNFKADEGKARTQPAADRQEERRPQQLRQNHRSSSRRRQQAQVSYHRLQARQDGFRHRAASGV